MSLNCILGQMSFKVTKNVISGPLVPIPNKWYRYPIGGIDTQSTDTLREVSIPSCCFSESRIPVSNLSIDTQREYRYPRAGTDTLRLVIVRVGVFWVIPASGILKFNVDGSMFGSSRKAGCGGVLRNNKGHILDIFSGPLSCIDSNEAEVQAIRHALVVLWESMWRSCPCVIIESDSTVVVSWVLHLERRPWKYWHWFQQIDELCARLPCVCFHNVFCEVNSVADALVKGGVGRSS
ncbi:hypothetical protein GQ457_16G022630 [Hibiscus cannabinus]